MHDVIKWMVLITEYCAFLVGILTIRRHNPVFRLFFFDLMLGLANETTGLILYYVFSIKNNLWAYDIYVLVETMLVGFACYKLIDNKLLKKTIPWVLGGFTGLLIVHVLLKGVNQPPIMSLMVSNIILTCLFLYVMIQLINTRAIGREPLFWISIGLIIYYGCSIPYWGVFSYLLKNDLPLLQKLLMLFWVIDILRYGLTTLSFLLLPKKTKTEILPI